MQIFLPKNLHILKFLSTFAVEKVKIPTLSAFWSSDLNW